MTRLIDLSRDNEARHSANARELRRQINEYQQRISTGSVAAPVSADVPALYDRIRDLEARIRSVRRHFCYQRKNTIV